MFWQLFISTFWIDVLAKGYFESRMKISVIMDIYRYFDFMDISDIYIGEYLKKKYR